eukprot:COSAG01_NODE_145_length_24103_cov_41.178012_5_plen_152_part_00
MWCLTAPICTDHMPVDQCVIAWGTRILQPTRLIPAYWICRRGTLPRWQATAVRCGTCKAVRGGRYCLCTTSLRLAGCWLAGCRLHASMHTCTGNQWCFLYSSTALRTVPVPFYEGFGQEAEPIRSSSRAICSPAVCKLRFSCSTVVMYHNS